MEQLENPALGTNTDADALDSLFNKYKERDEKKGKKFMSKEEMLAKYFNPRQDTEIFRALPKREGEELIEEGYFHQVQAGKFAKNKATVYCPAKNNPKVQKKDGDGNLVFDQEGNPVMVNQYCPLCAKAAQIKSTQNKSVMGKKEKELENDPASLAIFRKNKEIFTRASKFEAKLYYIIRGVDRGAEKNGVKFWRFKHNFKGQGVHDKLWKPIIQGFYKQTGKLYNDPVSGVDLMITVSDNTIPGTSQTYRDVTAINPRIPQSPLHTDPLIAKQWLDDKTVWRDVFKPKKAPGISEEQYLKLASEERNPGQEYDMRNTPYYDEQEKKWIFPNHPELEVAANTRNQNLDADSDSDIDVYNNADDEGYTGAAMSVVSQKNSPDITQMSTSAPLESKPSNFGSVDIGSSNTNDAYNDLPF